MARKIKDGKALPLVQKDIHVPGLMGLTVKSLSNGDLELRYETNGVVYSCTLKTTVKGYAIRRSSNLPTALVWSLLRDIRQGSREQALAALPKRIRAYALRRRQVDDTMANQGSRVVGGKIETAGSCNFIRLDLDVSMNGGDTGIIRFDLWYRDFSVHPTRRRVSADGPPGFVKLVDTRVDAIHKMLRALPLNEVCGVIYG